jgi:hypothetical protein
VPSVRLQGRDVTRPLTVPPGMVPVWMTGGGVLVLPVAVYVGALKLGKTLLRRQALVRRAQNMAEKPTRHSSTA